MAYVDPPTEPAVVLDDMSDEILDQIVYARDYADLMRDLLMTSIDELQELVGNYDPPLIVIDTTIDDIDKPTFPNPPTLETFVSDIYDTILTKVKNDIITGGNGLTDEVYSSIIQRELESRRVNQDREYQRAISAAGESGFDLPSGHIAVILSELAKENIAKDQDANNNALLKDYDVATENTRFAVQMGIELEKILRDAWNTTEERKVALFKAETDGAASEYASLVKWAMAKIEGIRIEAEVAMKNGDLSLGAYNSSVELAAKISETIASIASQSVASALGVINTTLGNSYTGSESRRESWSHDESLSESHRYEDG